jgi:hypothetical protein
MRDGKRGWTQPSLKRLHAGAAESAKGATTDGGGGFQGSLASSIET